MSDSLGDAAQTRQIMEKAIEATIIKMREVERPKVEIPAAIKWGAGVITALMTAGIIGFCFWIVTTLNEVQIAVHEINTQLGNNGAIEVRFQNLERRVGENERKIADVGSRK